MGNQERVDLIKRIEKERGSHLIAYVTSTRLNREVQMAMDSIRKIYDHLVAIGRPKKEVKVDLFLHSNGGDGTVPWRLVTLIREYASRLSVLVPFRAFSAATLTALGAHEIVMHPMGMLGPTDPTVANPFNPVDPRDPSRQLGISVEDVTAYIALIKEDAGIHHEDELIEGFKLLADKVHPLALGNVKRSLSQSRMMAKKLLALHMTKSEDEHKIKEIVDSLTSKLFYHGHPINRSEARDQVGLRTVVDPSEKVEDLMWKLYLEYEKEMDMEEPFNAPLEFVGEFPGVIPPPDGKMTTEKTAKIAYIESKGRTDLCRTVYQIRGVPHASGGIQTSVLNLKHGWVKET
jgi:hypothetical protein